MKKNLILGTLLAAALTSTAYAENTHSALDSAEKGSLASIAVIDKNEILVSVVAENKKVDSAVMDYAKMMIDQHGSNLTQILEMENTLKTGQLTGGEAEKLAAEGKALMMKLGALQGNDFAHAYANAMVKGHEAALHLIDTELLKTAKSEEIKKFITDTRAVVATHLEHAKQLQDKLKS